MGDKTLSTLKYDKVLSFETREGIFECESGITLDQVLGIIVPKGWFLPVTPGTKFITAGGAIASDVHGKNHHVDGAFSRHVLEMDVVLGSGETITCSPTKYTDLFQATCGGMGLTGMITRVKFGLKKIETSYIKQKQIKAENLDEIIHLFDEYKHYTYSMAWIDCLKKGRYFGRSILIVGEHATFNDLNDKQRKEPLALPKKKPINFPFNLPSWVLNPFTVKIFNFLYYGKNFKKVNDNVVQYEPFFTRSMLFYTGTAVTGKKGLYNINLYCRCKQSRVLLKFFSE